MACYPLGLYFRSLYSIEPPRSTRRLSTCHAQANRLGYVQNARRVYAKASTQEGMTPFIEPMKLKEVLDHIDPDNVSRWLCGLSTNTGRFALWCQWSPGHRMHGNPSQLEKTIYPKHRYPLL